MPTTGRQARKRGKNRFAFTLTKDLKTPASHRVLSWFIVAAVVLLILSSAISVVVYKVNEKKVRREAAALRKNAEVHQRKKVVPLTEDEYKKEKHYSFYDQLSQRTFTVFDKEALGGEMPAVAQPPKSVAATANAAPNPTKTPAIVLLSTASDHAPAITHANTPPATTPIKTPETPATKPRFKRLQTGSFLSQNEASIQRKQLQAQGFSPDIRTATNQNGQTIYRVQIGPFAPNEISSVKNRLTSIKINFFETK